MNRFNHLAIVVSVVLHQALGFFWYSAAPWAGQRLEALGRPLSDLGAVDPVALGMDLIGWIVGSYVLAWLLGATETKGAMPGLLFGLVVWAGVALPAILPHYAFAGMPSTVTIIDLLNSLVAIVITTVLLASWQKGAKR